MFPSTEVFVYPVVSAYDIDQMPPAISMMPIAYATSTTKAYIGVSERGTKHDRSVGPVCLDLGIK